MSESNYIPDGSGVVMGDTKPMPDRGTGTGMTGVNTVTDGRSLDSDAINRIGGISGTGSDPMDMDMPCCDDGGHKGGY